MWCVLDVERTPNLAILVSCFISSLFRKNGWTQHTRWKIPIFFGGLLLLERPLDMINNPLRGGFSSSFTIHTVLHPDKNAILHELTGSYFYTPLENHRYTNNVTFLKMLPSHTESDENGLAIQKKFQVCGQSFQPIQCFLGPLMYPQGRRAPF